MRGTSNIGQKPSEPIPATTAEKPVAPTATETSVNKIAVNFFVVLAIILAPIVLPGIICLIFTEWCQQTKKIDTVANAQLRGS